MLPVGEMVRSGATCKIQSHTICVDLVVGSEELENLIIEKKQRTEIDRKKCAQQHLLLYLIFRRWFRMLKPSTEQL